MLIRRLGTGYLASLILFFIAISNAFSAPQFPQLTGRVVDNAHLLNQSQKAALAEKLKQFEAESKMQIVVVTLPSLQGYEIRDFGYQLGRHWAIGQKNKDNGVLLVIAPIERKVAIEVGYGLEGVLTDALSKLIIEHKIIPHFKKNNYGAGINSAVDTIFSVLSREGAQEELTRQYEQEEDISPLVIFILIIVLIIILNNMSGSRGRRSSTWSGPTGGSWSGGGGGFSGGGGSFGGGGASGGW